VTTGRGRSAVAALLVAVTAATVGACGSDDDGTKAKTAERAAAVTTTSASHPAISKPEFVRRANELCEAGADETKAKVRQYRIDHGYPPEGPPKNGPMSLEDNRVVFARIIGPDQLRTVDAIDALGRPPGDEATVDRLLEATRDALRALARDPFTEEVDAKFEEANRLTNAYGLDVCGR
jgi:hypothetical protein